MGKVSVIIPGRCEKYFQQTIESCLENATGDVEIVPVFDGYEPDVTITDKRVRPLYLEESVGQRAAYNLGVKYSTGEYVMKLDAHALPCPGYDEILQSNCPEKTVVLPEMRRLDAFKWEPKKNGRTHFMYFGLDVYCHFWSAYGKLPEAKIEYPEVLTGQGSCWFTTREWNDHIGLLDEGVGSWGNVGIEVSLRTWLCGGSQIVNKNAWQAHWFRKDHGGFPYPMNGRQVAKAHKYTFNNYYFKDDAFKNQTRPFSWLIHKFKPPGWEAYLLDEYKAPRVIVYYTDSKLEPRLAEKVRKQIKKVAGLIPIISVSQEPLNFGKNICVGEKPRSALSMYEQQLEGCKAAAPDSIIYLCEHDVFYHPSHFAFLPKTKKHCWFNTNRYHYRFGMDSFLKARGRRAYSQAVAYRETLIPHFETRIEEQGKVKLHIPFKNFVSDRPNIDIRHGKNLTPDSQYKRDWLGGLKRGLVSVSTNIPGWGGPKHFGSRVGYKELIVMTDAAEHLRKKFKRSLPQPSPVRCIGFKRDKLPAIFNEVGFKRGAEVGVREGLFSELLLKSINGLELTCVDIWEPYPGHKRQSIADKNYNDAKQRLIPLGAKLERTPSLEYVQHVPEESLDFVYIDAAHWFDAVICDIVEWSKKVKSGGIVSGHDYYRGRNNGVLQAVDAYTHAHNINEWFITDEKEPSFFWVKP